MGFQNFVSVENAGYARGIMVACKDDKMKISLVTKEDHFIHLEVENIHGEVWMFTIVYASPQDNRRRCLWESMKNIVGAMNKPWLVTGDFNDIVCASEKKGGGPVSIRKCNLFRDNIDDCSSTDLGANGTKFTWRGPVFHGGKRNFERLDRALINEDWILMFINFLVKVLPRVDFSDHHPIMITLNNTCFERCPKPF